MIMSNQTDVIKIRCECSNTDVIFVDQDRAYCTKCISKKIVPPPLNKKTAKNKKNGGDIS
ncbi:MAG: hypothetical protein C4522_11705 [Desulfobacteraceae bacterium]|nr:MAG: hypothetical protein C4522_11705 [Desulfobacteraceae bacterium]